MPRGGWLAGAVAAALKLAVKSGKDIDPRKEAAILGLPADVVEQQIADLKASGDYDRIVHEVLAERDA